MAHKGLAAKKKKRCKEKTIAANKKVNAANKKVNAANKNVIAANKNFKKVACALSRTPRFHWSAKTFPAHFLPHSFRQFMQEEEGMFV